MVVFSFVANLQLAFWWTCFMFCLFFLMFRKTRYKCKHGHFEQSCNSRFNSLWCLIFFDQKFLIILYTNVTLTVHGYKYPVDCFSRLFFIRNSNNEERNSEKVGRILITCFFVDVAECLMLEGRDLKERNGFTVLKVWLPSSSALLSVHMT